MGTSFSRAGLILGLLGLGASLGGPSQLRVLRWGLIVVYLTALVSGLALQGWELTQLRLSHPYVPPVSLGIAGALGIWLAMDVQPGESWRSGLLWRLPLGGLALLTVLLSGSRGPLAVALVGTALMLGSRRAWLRRALPLALLAALPTLVVLGGRLQDQPLTRLITLDLTGRDLIWSDALSVAQALPWGGAGTLLLGPRIAPPGDTCTWFEALEVRGVGCPTALEQINNMWVFAHNGAVQALGETGLIGTAGLFLLLGGVLVAARASSPMVVAMVFALLVGDLTDNVTLLPGPFFSVVFWLAAGSALSRAPAVSWPATAGWGGALLLIMSFPLWTQFLPVEPGRQLGVTGLVAPEQWRGDEPYAAAARFSAPSGTYRVQLRACQQSCVTIATRSFSTAVPHPDWQWLIGPLPSHRQVGGSGGQVYRLELRLWLGKSVPWRTRPIAATTWNVMVRP
ncbi:O-antigen ligase family protein [Deinococcus arboris]